MRTLIFAAALLSAACGSKPASEEKKVAEAPKPVEYFHVDPATAGGIKGAVTFAGTPPTRKVIEMESDAGCQKETAGKKIYDTSIQVGKGGALANAFVYIQAGLEGKQFEPNTEVVILDQHDCTFVPHIIPLRAGQTLELKNSDKVAHNIHPLPKNNREWNQEQAPQAPPVDHRFARPEIMIPVKCNIHDWMHSYIGVVDHPYFAVTGPDGAFNFQNVPPGDYTLGVWHEKFGKQEQPVHVAATASAAVNFTYR